MSSNSVYLQILVFLESTFRNIAELLHFQIISNIWLFLFCRCFSLRYSKMFGRFICAFFSFSFSFICMKTNLESTANMCSEITVKVHLKNCNFEKLQFFTADLCSLYLSQVKNCNFNTIFM